MANTLSIQAPCSTVYVAAAIPILVCTQPEQTYMCNYTMYIVHTWNFMQSYSIDEGTIFGWIFREDLSLDLCESIHTGPTFDTEYAELSTGESIL